MSKSKEVLIKKLQERVGATTCPRAVVDELFTLGALDHIKCRQAAVRVVFAERYAASESSARAVMGEIGDEFGMCRETVLRIVHGA